MNLPPLSFSFNRDLANCPHKAFRRYVKRDAKFDETPESREGKRVHDQFRDYLTGRSTEAFPDAWKALAAPLKRLGARAEVPLGMTADRAPVGFYSDPWARGRLDAYVLKETRDGDAALLVDWKTGKVREDPRELAFHAMLLKAHHPSLGYITGCYAWLAEGRLGPMHNLTHTDQVYHATRAVEREAEDYEITGEWPKKPNPLCSWCNVEDCEFNKKE